MAVTVFGSAHPLPGDEQYRLAYELGRELARGGFVLCNGGYGGTMEASARGASEAGGHTVGVVSRSFGDRTPNRWIRETVTVSSMVERLLKLVHLGDAYVVLQGGTGTLLELAAVWEFMNKGEIREKPTIILGDFWEEIVDHVRRELIHEGRSRSGALVAVAPNVRECIALLGTMLQTGGQSALGPGMTH